ncbi:MAG: competence protein ComE, partial [Propionibacterium sp.]
MKTKQTSTIFTDLRMVPLALVSWSLMWLVTGNLLSPIAVLLVGVSLAALILRFRISPKLVAVALLAIAMAIIGLVRVDRMSVIGELLATDKTVVAVQVKLPSEPRVFTKSTRPAFALAKCELLQITIRGNRYQTDLPVTVVATNSTAKTFAELKVGSVIEFFAIATSPEEGEPVAAVLKITKDLKISSGPGIVDNTINRIRSALVAAMANSPPRQAALIPSLVVGDTSAIDETMAEQFKATALTHLLAVSGANLTLLLAFLLTVVKWLGIRGWAIRAIALTGVVAFIAICRGEPSVLRAAAMGIVALAALGSGRGGHAGLRNLSVAIIALLILDPWLARSWGFALSVSASAGILIWGKAWKEAMQTWAPEWFSEALVIPLAAQLATQPLITAL